MSVVLESKPTVRIVTKFTQICILGQNMGERNYFEKVLKPNPVLEQTRSKICLKFFK